MIARDNFFSRSILRIWFFRKIWIERKLVREKILRALKFLHLIISLILIRRKIWIKRAQIYARERYLLRALNHARTHA